MPLSNASLPDPMDRRSVGSSVADEQAKDSFSHLRIPLAKESKNGLRSIPRLDLEKYRAVGQGHRPSSWAGVVEHVNQACPMRTDAARLLVIQERLLDSIRPAKAAGPDTLHLHDRIVRLPDLAEAIWGQLENTKYEPRELIEAAVQLYLQGAYSRLIESYLYPFFSEAIFYQRSQRPRTGVYNEGKFAHGEVLYQLIVSQDPTERSVARSFFENGTIGHLALWLRGTSPECARRFVSEVCREAFRDVDDEKSGSIVPTQLARHLLPHLVNGSPMSAPVLLQLKWRDVFRDPKFNLERIFVRGTYLVSKLLQELESLVQGPLRGLFGLIDSSREKPSIPRSGSFATTSSMIPQDYLRIAREEITQIKIPWESSPAKYAERFSRDAGYGDVVRAVFEVSDRREKGLSNISVQDLSRWFFPNFFFTDKEPVGSSFGSMPVATEISESCAEMIVTTRVDDAIAFYDVIKCLKESYLLRDEDDLHETLLVLRDKLFSKPEHSRLKVVTYMVELINASVSADCITVFDAIGSEMEDSRWLPDSEDREVRVAAGLMGIRKFVQVLVEPAESSEVPGAEFSDRVMKSLLAHPRAAAAFVYWMSLFNREPFRPLTVTGEILKSIKEVKDSWLSYFTRSQEPVPQGEEAAVKHRRRSRIEKVWRPFFERLKLVPLISQFAPSLEEKVAGGQSTREELAIVAEFFDKVTGMPCATKFLFLHYRAARLNLNYSARFPVWERLGLPGLWVDARFDRHDFKCNDLSEFKGQLRHRSAHIVLNPESFVPENECDLELFALACRLYRNGAPPEEVLQRALRALLPEWQPAIDGFEHEFDIPARAPSVFDAVIKEEAVAAQTVLVERNTGQSVDAFRKKIDSLKKERAPEVIRFDEQRAAIDRVFEQGPLHIIDQLERKYGLPVLSNDNLEGDVSESTFIHTRVVRLVGHLSAGAILLDAADADILFCAHAIRGEGRRGSLSHLMEFEGDVEVWGGVLEFISEGLSDPAWSEVLSKATGPVRQVLERCTDVSHLERELLPVTEQDSSAKKKGGLKLQFSLTRGPASRLIGSICDTCALESLDSHASKAFVTFSQVDTEGAVIHSFLGGCILIYSHTKDGEPVLILRGLNPQLRLLKKVSINGFFDAFVKYVADHVAAPLGVRRILAPYEMVSGATFSNRPLTHLAFKSRFRNNRAVVELDENHNSIYNGRDISDRCILVWSQESLKDSSKVQ